LPVTRIGLDLTVLNVALPTLAVDLHASTGQLQWFANAYNLVLAAALLPAGLLGDRFGRKRLLLVALELFALASVACAYAGSAGALIGARAVLGLGASFLLPLSVALRQLHLGAILATLVSFALFGVLFVMPQYFQAVGGADAFGTGLRLLPVIGGLLVGAQVAGRVAPRIGAKVTVAIGLGLLAAGLAAGATTAVGSGYGFAAAWFSVVGLGFGFAMPTAMDAAIGAIPTERGGVGSALVMAMRFVGGTIGVALLGTVLNADYHSRLDLTGLPTAAVEAVRRSVSGGVAAAQQLGSEPLLVSVRSAFVHAMTPPCGCAPVWWRWASR
jgi:MFS family permease